MTSINMQTGFVTGQGGDDGAGSDPYNRAAGFSVYRPRGSIDINLGRLPVADDVTVAVDQDIVLNDAFVCSSAGTPMSGVLGAGTVDPGDYLIYIGGTVTVAANWIAINVPDRTIGLPNCPPRFVRIVSTRPDGVG